MHTKIVYLHGIGDGDPEATWLAGLNAGLVTLGHAPLPKSRIIAPRYSSLLHSGHIDELKMPPVTYKAGDDSSARRDFERRQAQVERGITAETEARSFGFGAVPMAFVSPIQHAAVNAAPSNLVQVKRYVESEAVRAAVLRRILDQLPTSGEIILIGHSLGSVIAIDLLDHLSPDLHVRRFITVGSPANSAALNAGSRRLLKKFPYGRVDDWSNLFEGRDPVPAGRGLSTSFPAAQDFEIRIGAFHNANAYLSHLSIAWLVSKIAYPETGIAVQRSDVSVRLTDGEADGLLALHFAHQVREHIKDKDAAQRYGSALAVIQDNTAHQLTGGQSGSQRIVAIELQELAAGRLPVLPHRWELAESVAKLTALALTNVVEPYDIQIDKAPMMALPDMALKLGFASQSGRTIGEAIEAVHKKLGKGSFQYGRLLTAAAGLAIVAAGPVGLMMAAPAALAGGAAITSALAAFGPGGMIGGLAMLGGLTGTGMAVAAGAAVSTTQENQDPASLVARVAAAYAYKLLDLPSDDQIWYAITNIELQISDEINRIAPFTDEKSPSLVQRRANLEILAKLMEFMVEKKLTPEDLYFEEQQPTSTGPAVRIPQMGLFAQLDTGGRF